MATALTEKDLTEVIIGAFFDVHNGLGFGFLEYLYVNALEGELRARGHKVEREVLVPVYYKDRFLGNQRVDMIVDDKVIVEVKSSKDLPDIATRQLDNYLKGTGVEVGLLLHFGPSAKFYRRVWTKTKKSVVVSAKIR
jgi:GxxExxY protein